ncbi:MAG: hypothetical protein DWQ20_03615 [Actinobacteria bacterium]|nr:MAG: hypothetical protein DWQ20_03615 [Actinomycetota bacterium]
MSLFTSHRESRLWIWAGTAAIAVFASIPFAGSLVTLIEEPVATTLFVVGLLLILAGLVVFALRIRPGPEELAIALVIGAAYLLLFSRMSIPAERTHLVEYGVIAVLIRAALVERRSNGQFRHNASLVAVGAAMALGTVDELIQAFIPSRVFDWRDIGFNAGAALLAIIAVQALAWARKRRTGTTR